MHKFPLLVAGVAVVLSAGACNESTPSAPTGTSATTTASQVSATVTPVPLPMQLQNVPGGSPVVRYQLSGQVTFHNSTQISGRVTQITLAIITSQGQAAPENISLDLPLPGGGTVTHRISQAVEAPAGQVPSALLLTATGSDPSGNAFAVPPVEVPVALAASSSTGPFTHVFVVVEENEGHSEVIGNRLMPYLNSLAEQYGLATQYYANTHPSIGNYFMLVTGNIVTNSSNFSGLVTEDNIARQLVAAGKTWKSYAEDLPSVGYTGGDTGLYARRHNVFAFLSDVVNDPVQVRNLVPFTQFATDLANNAFPNYSFIVPNLCNDAHDCPLSTADAWLQMNIGPLVASAGFQRDGLLVITFDEAEDSDRTHGGGRIAWVAVSGKSKPGYRSATLYQHESTLRLTAEALGLTTFPNRAASAPSMREFFVY